MRNFLDAIHNKWRWPLIIFLIVLIILNSKWDLKLNDYSFKTAEENLNQYFVQTEGLGESTMGEEKSGNDLYDDNRILGENLYEMGDKKYLVYIFPGAEYREVEGVVNLEKAITAYKSQKGSIPLYSVETKSLVDTVNSVYIEQAPVVLELTRESHEGKYRVIMTNMYKTPAQFKRDYEVVKEEDKTISVKKKENDTTQENGESPNTESTSFWSKLKNFNIFGKDDDVEKESNSDKNGAPTQPTDAEEKPVEDTNEGFLDKLISSWR